MKVTAKIITSVHMADLTPVHDFRHVRINNFEFFFHTPFKGN